MRLEVGATSLAFISCHLAAHEGAKYYAARNDSLRQILSTARPTASTGLGRDGGVGAGKALDVAQARRPVRVSASLSLSLS